MSFDNFIKIPFNKNNLDRYIIRSAIKKSLDEQLKYFTGKLLDAGCGKMPYRNYIENNSNVTEYIGLDIESAISYDDNTKPDITWNGVTMPFENGSFNTCIATEVLEHCPDPEVFLKEVNRVLKPNGLIFLTIPFLWNLHEVPHDEYRYTPFSLERHLKAAGFVNISIKASGGWHLSLAQLLGLWVRRAPMNKRLRRFLSYLFLPIIKILIFFGNKEQINFMEGQMITGLYAAARKN